MKYQYEESMKEVLKVKSGGADALNRNIFQHIPATEEKQHRTFFYTGRFAACTLAAIIILLTGGIGISYAAGVKPVQTVLDHFTKRDENVIDKNILKGTSYQDNNHRLTMNEHYLDALGNGYMAFSLTTKDGGKEKDLAFGTALSAYYTNTKKNISKEFASYSIEPIYSEQQDSLDGIQLSFYGTQFPADSGEILIKMGKERFTFSNIKVTQPHYYEWKSPEGSVFLSSVGLIADGDTKTCDYINGIIGTEKDTKKIANVVYKDGQKEALQLLQFCGAEGSQSNRAVIQFSPWTELQKHLKEGRSWEEVEDEWERNFSIYTFNLDEISSIQIGDIILDVKDAIYH